MAAKKATKKAAAAKTDKTALNRADLADAVAKDLETSRASADRAIGAVLAGIQRGLKKSGKVTIVGFGSFEVRKRGARKGRNPQTGEAIKIKASRSVAFKAGKPLKDSV